MKGAKKGKTPISKHQSSNDNEISIPEIPNVTRMMSISFLDFVITRTAL